MHPAQRLAARRIDLGRRAAAAQRRLARWRAAGVRTVGRHRAAPGALLRPEHRGAAARPGSAGLDATGGRRDCNRSAGRRDRRHRRTQGISGAARMRRAMPGRAIYPSNSWWWGFTEQDSGLLATGKVAITGRYGEGEALHLLRREAPHLAFFPSVTPETWCFALDEALAAGLPIVAFDLGAIAERTRHSQRALLLPLLEKPSQINDRLLQFAAQRTLDHRHNDAMIEGTMEPSPMTTTSDEPAAPPAADALSASVQVLPLPAGLYLFSVKAAEPAPFIDGQLRLPAIHVGLGPERALRPDRVRHRARQFWRLADLAGRSAGGEGQRLRHPHHADFCARTRRHGPVDQGRAPRSAQYVK